MTDALFAAHARPLVITVLGRPAPQGSKHATLHKQSGRIVTMESSKRVKPWREAVKEATTDAIEAAGHQRLEGPVTVEIAFCFDPPKSAPKRRKIWPTTRTSGDLDKLQRAAFDALTDAGAFRDDSQVVHVTADKWHTDDPDSPLSIPGAVIALKEVAP
ncbi:RusA family crossover junction endodeoxyribonuclease [Pseudonocardia sp.]|uniref:RusA family crossover junction endodeoxyribonuclease n=1 Tax=Pseudonocardia sp. TaxID=60912 RepID=UPI002631C7FF|nr:RusA family crossover junction endodeoxyribonuclease [Pseudonocardia sp.]MCW2720491.1 Phage Holliday junction resolvase [Pseudonocardia sp.]